MSFYFYFIFIFPFRLSAGLLFLQDVLSDESWNCLKDNQKNTTTICFKIVSVTCTCKFCIYTLTQDPISKPWARNLYTMKPY